MIHEHGGSFHLLMSSSISLFSGLYFLLKRSLDSFIKFIPRNFIVFEIIINGIVFLISFQVCALLVHRKAADFWMLILYPATLLKEFMISSSVLVEFLGSLRYRIMSSANRDNLTIFIKLNLYSLKIFVYNSLFWLCLYWVSEGVWCWLYRISFVVFLPFLFPEEVWGVFVLALL
jgi:hypothetical protein